MAQFFGFEVFGPDGDTTEVADGVNLFERYNGEDINLDGRESGSDPTPGEDAYSLTLSISPGTAEIGQAFTVTIQARKNGLALVGQSISISTTNGSVGSVPTTVTSNTSGNAIFQIIAASIGSATITASMVVDGETYTDSRPIVVSVLEAPEDYDATGYGQVVLTIDNALAKALLPRVQRLSHQEQIRKHPTDTGLSRAASYENLEVAFLPPFLQ